MKKYSKLILSVVLFFVAIIPTIYIVLISIKESNKYQVTSEYVFQEKGFGTPMPIKQGTFQSYIILNGEIDCHERKVYSYDGTGSSLIENNTEIYQGMPIAVINGKVVKANFTGMLDFVQQGDQLSFVVKPFGNYIFKTTQSNEHAVTDKVFSVVDNHEQSYELEFIYCSVLQNQDTREYIYKIKDDQLYYGQKIRLYKEERLIENASYVMKDAVFYDKEFNCNMVQLLDEQQNVVGKTEVKIIGEDFNYYAIEYDTSLGSYVDYSYGLYRNTQNKSGDHNE